MADGEQVRSASRTSLIDRAAWVVLGGLTAATLVILSARWTAVGELASHFRWHVGWLALVALTPFALLRRWRATAIIAAFAAWGVAPEARLSLGGPGLAAGGTTLDVVSVNVLRINDRYDEVFDAALASDPDVIGLLEVSPEWRERAFARLGPTHPHVAEGTDTAGWNADSWGLMLFSRSPLTNVVVEPIFSGGRRLRPIVRADLELDGETITLQLVHTQRPGRGTRSADRRQHFDVLMRPLEARHRVIFGDLNSTSTSPLFARLCDSAGVRDSRQGFGRLSTWKIGNRTPGPVRIPIPGFLRLAVTIDHALVSEGIAVLHRDRFYVPGSDHAGIHARLALRQAD